MSGRQRSSFGVDFKHFFLRGLAALLPTLITLSLIWYVLNFLWESMGQYLIWVIKYSWQQASAAGLADPTNGTYIRVWFEDRPLYTRFVGVLLAVVLIYAVGLLIGNLIGRTFYRVAEALVMRIPIVRAIYPAVKQVTDFLLADKSQASDQFAGSKVVAVKPHASDIWSIALVTGPGLPALSRAAGEEMVTVFMPSSPTAFSGYVIMVPRSGVVELPLTVEEAMRLLVSGGVIMPNAAKVENGSNVPASEPRAKGRALAPEALEPVESAHA